MAITGLEAAGTRGSCAILGVPATTNQSCMAVYGTEKLDVKYLFYYYSSNGDDLAFKYCQGTKQQSYTASIVKKLPIILPPIAEQKKIANALSEADQLIDSFARQIAKKKAIKQGAMQELLTGKKHLPGFSGEWEAVVLGEASTFYNGGTPSKKREDWWNGNIPWISSSDLCDGSITAVNIDRFITHDAVEHSPTRICPKNAVLVVTRVGVGKVAVAPCELCTSQDFTTIVSDRHNPYFLAYMLVPILKELAAQAQGTSIKGVTVEEIQK